MLLQEQPGAATAEALAHALAMSPRTLHRQLQEEGASLQALKDEVRQEQAMHLLRRTARPVKQVAQAVGFRSEKAFRGRSATGRARRPPTTAARVCPPEACRFWWQDLLPL
jgi:AraC-like DNA-binding protein